MAQTFDVAIWYKDAQESRDHYDSGVALQCLKEWNEAMSALQQELRNNPALVGDFEHLQKELQLVAFPELTLDEVKTIMQSRCKEFLVSDIDIKDAFSKRYTFAGYGQEETERKSLKEVILKNTEQIGGVTIGDWLRAFDKVLDLETRDDTAVAQFFRQSKQVASLKKNEQIIVQRLLDVYSQFIASELLNIFDLAVLYSKAGQLDSGQGGVSDRKSGSMNQGQSVRSSSSLYVATISLPLLQALSKYENLGNQLITRERIKVKSQAEPVRPSLLYWLKYYRDELGIGQHNSVERGDFLFRSENGRKLSPEERERVNLILKSIEEGFPLAIDTEHQEIVFPVFQGVLVPTRLPEMSRVTMPAGILPQAESMSGGETTSVVTAHVGSVDDDVRSDVGRLVQSQRQAFSHPSHIATQDVAGRQPGEEKPQYGNGKMRINQNMPFSALRREASEQKEQGATRLPVPSGTGEMSFSASHVFPAEKEGVEKKAGEMRREPLPAVFLPAPALPLAREQKPKPTAPKQSPFSIHPVSLGRKDE
ncbi:MAG: hypothetical protein WAV46_01840 [Candidatus Moraniibacteriota bacterium]